MREHSYVSRSTPAIKHPLFYNFGTQSAKEPQYSLMPPVVAWGLGDVLVRSDEPDWVFPDREIRSLIVKSLMQVDDVGFIYAQINRAESVVWTLLKTYNRSARERVYAKELEVCDMLDIYDFDFRVTSMDLVSPIELSDSGFEEIFRRA